MRKSAGRMSENRSKLENFSQVVDGFKIPKLIPAEIFRSALRYKPRDDDVFIVTYPKCGTTWVQHILLLIFSHGDPTATENFFTKSPFLEFMGPKAVEMMPRPGAIKVHLPFNLCPRSEKAKYIYITRNPKDCCVSYYHHMKSMLSSVYDGITFDNFFEEFISGGTDHGDYFDNLLSWYEHRNDPNVLFLTYEEMKQNIEDAILKMASFIDDKLYAEPLRRDPLMLQNVVQFSSFSHMREVVNKSIDAMFAMTENESMIAQLPDELKETMAAIAEMKRSQMQNAEMKKPDPSNFVRKGIIGDWKNYFTEEQSKRLNQKFLERTKGTDIANWWKEYM